MNINNCPWCKHSASIKTEDLGGSRGTGYPGHFLYWVECTYCGATTPKNPKVDDVYRSSEQARTKAIEYWNNGGVR